MTNRLLKHLRQTGKPYLGVRAKEGRPAVEQLSAPQIQTMLIARLPDRERPRASGGLASVIGRLNLLPYFDDATGETAEHRDAYRKMLREPTIKTALLSKCLPLASLDLNVTPADPTDPRQTEIAQWVRWNLLHVGFGVPGVTVGVAGLVENLTLPKLIEGYVVAHKRFEPIVGGPYHGKNRLAEITAKPPQTYTLGLTEYGRVEKIVGRRHNNGFEFDPSAFVVSRYMPLYDNPLGMSDLRAAYRAFWLKDTVWKLRAMYQEKYAVGGLVGKYANPDDKTSVEEAMKAFRTSTYLAVPDSVMIEALSIAGRGDADYAAALKDLDHEIMVGITGAFLQSMEGAKTGSLAMGRVHQSTSELFVWYLAENLAGDLNGQVVPDLVAMNYAGVPALPPVCTVSFGGVNDADLAPQLAIDEGLQRLGWRHSRAALERRYKREWATDDADAVEPKPSAPAASPVMIPFADSTDVALGGQVGRQAVRLMNAARRRMIDTLTRITKPAVERRLRGTDLGSLYSIDELTELSDTIASVIATAHLLGRFRVRAELERRRRPQQEQTFAERDEPSAPPVEPVPPEKALAYFQQLMPGLTGDPEIFGPLMRRRAFTLAVTTDATLLKKVQDVIADSMAAGNAAATADVQDILDRAGVSPSNPQYAEMVVRTNTMDAYNQGQDEERQDPDVIEAFPVWRYDGIEDGREGDDHRPKFGKYYPATASFAEVRGDRPFNCRCTATPIYIDDWRKLQKAGARVETSW